MGSSARAVVAVVVAAVLTLLAWGAVSAAQDVFGAAGGAQPAALTALRDPVGGPLRPPDDPARRYG